MKFKHSSSRTRLSALIPALGAVAAIALLAAPGASAEVTSAGGLDYVASKVGTAPTDQTVKSARCPSGTSTIGGGADAVGTLGEQRLAGMELRDLADANTKPDDAWRAAADNLITQSRALKVYAICGPESYDYLSTSWVGVPANGAYHASFAACPADTHVVSGGGAYELPGFSRLHLRELYPIDGVDPDASAEDGVTLHLANKSAVQRFARVQMVCASGLIAFVDAPLDAPKQAQSVARASCPPKFHAVGGGAELSGSGVGLSLNGSRPVDGKDKDRAPDDGWKVRVDNLNQTTDYTGTVHAICMG